MSSLSSYKEEHEKIMQSMAASVQLIKRNCKRLREETIRDEKRIRLQKEREAREKEKEKEPAVEFCLPESLLLTSTFTDFEPAWMQILFQPMVDNRNEILSPLTAIIRETPFGNDVTDVFDDAGDGDPVESLLEGPVFCDLVRQMGVSWVNRDLVNALFDVLIYSNQSSLIYGSYRGIQSLLDRDYQPWMPDAECFNGYFKKCGYTCDGRVVDWEEVEERSSKGPPRGEDWEEIGHRSPKGPEASTEITCIKVRLILTLAPAAIKSSPVNFIPKDGDDSAVQLVCMLAHVLMDFSAEGFRVEATGALKAVMGCVDERKSSQLTEKIVNGLAELGPTHRSQLQLLDKFWETTPKARALKRQWAMASLRRVLPKEVSFDPSLTDTEPATCVTALVELMQDPKAMIKAFEKDYNSSGGKVVPMDWWLGDSLFELLSKILYLCLKRGDAELPVELRKRIVLTWTNFQEVWSEYSLMKGSMNSVGSANIQYKLRLMRLKWEPNWGQKGKNFWDV